MEELLFHLLLQLALVIAAARAVGWVASRLGQPSVVGEIMAGLLLGPTFIGGVFPRFLAYAFPDDSTVTLRALSELGLVLLMFLIGLEFDFSHLRRVGKTAASVAAAGVLIPFVLAIVLANWIYPQLATNENRLGFQLIFAVALSITAIPILGRIMIEFGLQRTQIGALTITAAAIDDALGWILLAGVSALVHGDFRPGTVVNMTLATLVFVSACIFIVRPIAVRGQHWLCDKSKQELSLPGFSFVLILVFLAAATTNFIGIFSIFGPFVLGASLSGIEPLRHSAANKLRDTVYALFLPIFFTYSGLRTNVGLLTTPQDWLICVLVVLTAVGGKMLGCGVAARLGGLSWRESGIVAAMMNTRALMGLIAINVGRDLGVISDRAFSVLVIMAIVTTLMTAPILRRLLRSGRDIQEL